MNETERLIVASSFASSTQNWEEFAKRIHFALGRLQEADQAANKEATMKNLKIWEKAGRD